jgi:anti-sigma factor ChrR (cupin superfamily)
VPRFDQVGTIIMDLAGLSNGTTQVPWQPYRDGVDIHRLYGDGETGAAAALLRYAAGASIPAHRHAGYEHIYVLSGYQIDGQGTHHAGTLMINPPGTGHAVHAPEGCTVLAIWERSVVFLGDDA